MKLSRREFAAVTLAASMAKRGKAQVPATSRYTGPLTGVEDKVQARKLDSLDFSLDEYRSAPLRLRFRARSRAEAILWQKQLREKLISLMGGFPATKCPLKAEVIDQRKLDGYTRERVVFQSRPNMSVFAYLLVPDGARQPRAAVICLPGHGRGVDPVAGVDDNGELDTTGKEYQHSFAEQAVKQGFVTLAVEMIGFGCRRDPAARKKGAAASSCQPAAGAALLLGNTMAAWRTYDVIRALDYLATRPEVDAQRIGCMGISGGGTVTLYAAAVDRRIRAAVLSGSFALYRDCIFSIAHCIDNYVPGMLRWAEMPDVAGLIAPQPVFVESGERDNIFPVDSARAAVTELRRIYGVWGAEDRVGHEVFPAEHSFWGKGAFAFLQQQLV